MLRLMKLHRAIEDRLEIVYRQGKLVGPLFVGRGQEAVGVGGAVQLSAEDVIFPSHRDLGAFLAKGVTAERIFLQYLGRKDGPMRGRDGNLHMGDWNLRIGAFISHMADTVPVAAGAAFAFKARGQAHAVLCYNGDGSTSRGDWHEGLNLASLLRLPIVYVCLNNQYAYSTPLSKQMAVATVAERASGYGMPVDRVDGNDVLAVYDALRPAIERARSGAGPSFVECVTYRMTGHGSHDDASYVPDAFFDEGRRTDPIVRFLDWLIHSERMSTVEIDEMDAGIAAEVEAGWLAAEASEYPPGPDTLLGVYAGSP
jgi:TPP-dependent pyruvate/acetoin dehydrogenase alpha subunit